MTERDSPAVGRPRAVIAYIGFVILLLLGSLAFSWVLVGPPSDGVVLATLTVLGVLSQVVREPDVGSRVGFSFLSIIVVASMALVGPVGCALVGALANSVLIGPFPMRARLFNPAMSGLVGVLGGLTYLLVGGAQDLSSLDGPVPLLLHVGIPLMIADVVQMLLNAALLAGIVLLSNGVPFRVFFAQMVTNSGVAYIGYGFIGFLFVILWVPAEVGPFSAVLILAPLFVARWAFVQYGDELRAHQSSVNALVAAVEIKDPYAVGHSARIATLSSWIGQTLSLGNQELEALRSAAMLHDVGKVGLGTRLVRRPSSVSPETLAQYERHPALGVEVVEGIEFLRSSLGGIRHHHERWDGTGYPDRLSRSDIPLVSRVIAVADAFDALTTPRPDRPSYPTEDALAILEARAGTHFDPDVVAALRHVMERHPWEPGPVDPDSLDAMAGYVDHDDPLDWDRLRPHPPPQPSRSPERGESVRT